MPAPPTVTLCGTEIPVYAQTVPYLTRKFERWYGTLSAEDIPDGAAGLRQFVIGNAYALLSILIPALPKRVPRWQWDGFGDADAAAADDWDEERDQGPTTPQILAAFETAIEVNRFDVFRVLGQIVDPQMLRGTVRVWLAEQIHSTTLPSSPSESGESDSTSSGTSPRTSTVNAA